MKQKAVTIRDLRCYLKKWQKKLRLQDWEMRVDWGTEEQMRERLAEDGDFPEAAMIAKQAVACTDASNPYQTDTSYLEYRKNRILVKRNKELTHSGAESIVLHELLHALLWYLAPDDKDPAAMIILEQIVNTLESAIIPTEGE